MDSVEDLKIKKKALINRKDTKKRQYEREKNQKRIANLEKDKRKLRENFSKKLDKLEKEERTQQEKKINRHREQSQRDQHFKEMNLESDFRNEKNNLMRRQNDMTKMFAQKVELSKKKHFDEMKEQLIKYQKQMEVQKNREIQKQALNMKEKSKKENNIDGQMKKFQKELERRSNQYNKDLQINLNQQKQTINLDHNSYLLKRKEEIRNMQYSLSNRNFKQNNNSSQNNLQKQKNDLKDLQQMEIQKQDQLQKLQFENNQQLVDIETEKLNLKLLITKQTDTKSQKMKIQNQKQEIQRLENVLKARSNELQNLKTHKVQFSIKPHIENVSKAIDYQIDALPQQESDFPLNLTQILQDVKHISQYIKKSQIYSKGSTSQNQRKKPEQLQKSNILPQNLKDKLKLSMQMSHLSVMPEIFKELSIGQNTAKDIKRLKIQQFINKQKNKLSKLQSILNRDKKFIKKAQNQLETDQKLFLRSHKDMKRQQFQSSQNKEIMKFQLKSVHRDLSKKVKVLNKDIQFVKKFEFRLSNKKQLLKQIETISNDLSFDHDMLQKGVKALINNYNMEELVYKQIQSKKNILKNRSFIPQAKDFLTQNQMAESQFNFGDDNQPKSSQRRKQLAKSSAPILKKFQNFLSPRNLQFQQSGIFNKAMSNRVNKPKQRHQYQTVLNLMNSGIQLFKDEGNAYKTNVYLQGESAQITSMFNKHTQNLRKVFDDLNTNTKPSRQIQKDLFKKKYKLGR